RPGAAQLLQVRRVAPRRRVNDGAVRARDRRTPCRSLAALELSGRQQAHLDASPGICLTGEGPAIGRGAKEDLGARPEETRWGEGDVQGTQGRDVEENSLAEPRPVATRDDQWAIGGRAQRDRDGRDLQGERDRGLALERGQVPALDGGRGRIDDG